MKTNKTIDELNDKLFGINKEIEGLESTLGKKRGEANKTLDEIAKAYRELCSEYLGKRVKLWFMNRDGVTDVEGYLNGIYVQYGIGKKDVYPDVARINSDGSKSKRMYPWFKLKPMDDILEIELVQEGAA